MMQNWFLIYSTPSLPQATILKGMLEENSVPVMIINKQSSSYINFGEIELYVPVDMKEVANQLVAQST